jgi:carboxylesterase type B
MSCGVLLASPLAEPYFQRAVCQSGAASNAIRTDVCARRSVSFAKILGVDPAELSTDLLSDVTAAQLVTAQKVIFFTYIHTYRHTDRQTYMHAYIHT